MPFEPEIDDLWPDLSPAAIVTPASILKTQAAVLSRKSNGLLQGEVKTWAKHNEIYHVLMLVVPALENYRYSLLRIHHKVTPVYPVYVDESPAQGTDDASLMAALNTEFARLRPIPDEATFREWLRKALASAETKRILESLLAQATV
jgi:hypothetical protein